MISVKELMEYPDDNPSDEELDRRFSILSERVIRKRSRGLNMTTLGKHGDDVILLHWKYRGEVIKIYLESLGYEIIPTPYSDAIKW